MNDKQPARTLPSDIPSMLLAVEGRQLLLPGVAVAEIIHYTPPDILADSPDWFIGTLEWRTLHIPLISYDRLAGNQGRATYRHVIVLNSAGTNEQLPFTAIPILGIPRLIRLTQKDAVQDSDATLSPVDLAAITLPSGDTVYIPDIAAIEKICVTFYTCPEAATP